MRIFDLEQNVPTYAYELDEAVKKDIWLTIGQRI